MFLKKISKKIFSKEEKVENLTLRKKYRVLGIKVNSKELPREYIASEKYKKNNKALYSEIVNKLKRFKKIILYFDHSLGGGTETYFINQLRHLEKDEIILRIQYMSEYESYKLTVCGACRRYEVYESNLKDLVNEISIAGIDVVVLNNIVAYPSIEDVFSVIKFLKQENRYLKTILMGHDFYMVCPQYNLLDENMQRCDICLSNKADHKCWKNQSTSVLSKIVFEKDFNITKWRTLWHEFIIDSIDEFRCFSQSSRDIFLKVYPDIENKLKLVPHKIEPFKNTLNIAILGHMTVHKGAAVISDLLNYFGENNIWDIHLYVFGINYCNIPKNLYVSFMGEYEREQLPDLLKQYHIDAIFIPSIWDETFSYTTAESIAMDYPVVCFNFGGQADQVRLYNKGFIVDSFEPTDIYKTLKIAASKSKVLQ